MGKLKTKLANAPASAAKGRRPLFLGLKFAGLLAGLFLGGGTMLDRQGHQPKRR